MSTSRKRRSTFDAFTYMSNLTAQPLCLPSTSSNVGESIYIDNSDCDRVCDYCGALFWFDERLRAISSNQHPRYNQCCKGGHVKLPYPRTPHDSIVQLFSQPDFLANIRAYNYMFSMTSFGGKVNDAINSGSAPYVFKVEGQIYHWLGSLCPMPNEHPRFLQMYIYDTENEVSNRLRFFPGNSCIPLNADTVDLILCVLETCNELVHLFRSARDLWQASIVPTFSIRLFACNGSLRYDNPSPGCIGAIITDPEPESDGFAIVI